MEENRDLIQNQVQKNLNAIQPTSDPMTQAVKSMEHVAIAGVAGTGLVAVTALALSHKAEISIGWKNFKMEVRQKLESAKEKLEEIFEDDD